jgi:hypothetical protein
MRVMDEVCIDRYKIFYCFVVKKAPGLETIENVMRLLPMIVQAVWGNKSPLFQLPHFTDDVLRHCVNKRVRVFGYCKRENYLGGNHRLYPKNFLFLQ